MSGGPISDKMRFLSAYLRSRAGEDGREAAALSLAEMCQVAGVLDALIVTVAALEDRPVPHRLRRPTAPLRVIKGGRVTPTQETR
jgi:hypothetical protein